MSDDATVIIRRDGRAGRILLNRPRVLNTLTLDMVRAMTKALIEFRDDPHVHAVVVEGTGDRAFCAGGDIRALRDGQLSGDRAGVEEFFREEYDLNFLIAGYNKPYVALIDGICMGGGIGVSVHGAYRVATEQAMFAMPETAIGFFPDIGGTFFLPRLPGQLGVYLGLTGLRTTGADAVHAGFATHFISRANLPALSAALADIGVAALARFAEKLPPYGLTPHLEAIDRCFAADTIGEIAARLAAEAGEWAAPALQAFHHVSPTALAFTLEAFRRAADMTLRDALDAEFRLTRTTMAYPDFAEGVRAMVVDKDRQPKWSPASIDAIQQAEVARMFL
ncbi:MAG: enoyl-CoA hydratase/isomerase family protein [Acetobacteraceae bacterium]|nr:enoyl-CoA hydratase/isomerase family protein [Acetobacteraceae bacterium]